MSLPIIHTKLWSCLFVLCPIEKNFTHIGMSPVVVPQILTYAYSTQDRSSESSL